MSTSIQPFLQHATEAIRILRLLRAPFPHRNTLIAGSIELISERLPFPNEHIPMSRMPNWLSAEGNHSGRMRLSQKVRDPPTSTKIQNSRSFSPIKSIHDLFEILKRANWRTRDHSHPARPHERHNRVQLGKEGVLEDWVDRLITCRIPPVLQHEFSNPVSSGMRHYLFQYVL